jgi:hypothetical protein
MARKGKKRRVAPRKVRSRKRSASAKTRGVRQPRVRAMSELSDAEKFKVFAAVQETLFAHGVGNTLAELHFASDELGLVCKDGEVRRVVAFRCGPGVCTKSVCVPLIA